MFKSILIHGSRCVCLLVVVAGFTACAGSGAGMEAYRRGEFAVAWQQFTAAGSPEADFALGTMSYKGEGRKRDPVAAAQYFLRAAEQGHAGAQYNLGIMRTQGEGVTRDLRLAAHWFRLAADQGYAKAQYNLGLMYVRGDGVAKDRREALRWLVKAAKQGHRRAQEQLEGLLLEKELKAK